MDPTTDLHPTDVPVVDEHATAEGMVSIGSEAKPGFDCGRITYEEFKSACKAFLELSTEMGDPWRMEGDSEVQGDWCLSVSYLRRHEKKSSSSPSEAESCQPLLISCRYDIIYSISHCVPVLYFLLSDECGRSLSLEDLWKMYPLTDKNSMWEVVTQQDHPVLGSPFFFVHPCASWKVLSNCYPSSVNFSSVKYLISWLSVVGNSFGLNLSHKYLHRILNYK